MFIDSDVLIWGMRGNPKAGELLDSLEQVNISVITYMELIQGAKGKTEAKQFVQYLKNQEIAIWQISEPISSLATQLVTEFYHSHSLELKDALIGATAVIHGLPLATGNDKHFKVIDNLELRVFRP